MGDALDFPADEGLRVVLRQFGVEPSELLGHGGEAWVYALDDLRVLRVLHDSGNGEHVLERQTLVDELRQHRHVLFKLPEVLECGSIGERTYAVERRLPGVAVSDALHRVDRPSRRSLIEAHLDTAALLGDLHLDARTWFGDLLGGSPVRATTWRGFLHDKAAWSLGRAPGFEHVDPAELAADLPDTTEGSFVHLDAFAGNMLAVGSVITSVIDIGASSIRGDRRLDPLSAVVYLCTPAITPNADEDDRRVAQGWLANAGLSEFYEPARRWIAAFWAWAVDDPTLHQWCRSVLL
ncbi:MAG: hypothetical protein R2733_10125 [Acidimicrobiales bacterium]